MMQDPDRLSDDPAGSDLARALRDAQGDVLSPEAVERVQAGLLTAGIGAAGAASAAGAAGGGSAVKASVLAKLFGGATTLKVGLAALGLVAVAGLAREWRAHGHEGPASATPLERAVATQASMDPASLPPRDPASPPQRDPASPLASDVAEPVRAEAPPAKTATPVRTTVSTPSPAETTTGPAPQPPSPREGALLLEARRTLDADPAKALALVRAHEREFPRSQLEPERARIAAEAGKRLGR